MTYYHVTFSYGETIQLGRCVLSAQDDTTLSQYWTSTESAYKSFSDFNIAPGERILFNEGSQNKILLGRVSSLTASEITLSSNPGQRAYNRILQHGYITPFIERDQNIYSYRIDKYVGASLTKNGQSFVTYAESNPLSSDAVNTTNHSIVSLFFEKGDVVEEVRIKVKNKTGLKVIKNINKLFRQQNDINFSGEGSTIDSDILGVSSVISTSTKDFY